MKQHVGKAYTNLLILGRGVGVPGTIAKKDNLSDEEDVSINTITGVMSTMQMSSNVNARSINAGINAMRQDVATLRAVVQTSR